MGLWGLFSFEQIPPVSRAGWKDWSELINLTHGRSFPNNTSPPPDRWVEHTQDDHKHTTTTDGGLRKHLGRRSVKFVAASRPIYFKTEKFPLTPPHLSPPSKKNFSLIFLFSPEIDERFAQMNRLSRWQNVSIVDFWGSPRAAQGWKMLNLAALCSLQYALVFWLRA